MDRIRYLIGTPAHLGPAQLVELHPFKAALACEDGVITAMLQSYSSRTLTLEQYAARDGGPRTKCSCVPK
jgi:hypothetical protein